MALPPLLKALDCELAAALPNRLAALAWELAMALPPLLKALDCELAAALPNRLAALAWELAMALPPLLKALDCELATALPNRLAALARELAMALPPLLKALLMELASAPSAQAASSRSACTVPAVAKRGAGQASRGVPAQAGFQVQKMLRTSVQHSPCNRKRSRASAGPAKQVASSSSARVEVARRAMVTACPGRLL